MPAQTAPVGRTAKPPPQSDRKQAIIEAAQALFAQRGYSGVGLREIARQAGVSLTLLNHHFGAKQQLFEAVVLAWQPAVADCLGELEALNGSAVPSIEAVVKALSACLRRLGAHPQGQLLLWLNLRSRHDDNPQVLDLLMQLFVPIARAFVDQMARAVPTARRDQLTWLYVMIRGVLIERVASARWVSEISGDGNDPAGATPDAEVDAALQRFLMGAVRAYFASTPGEAAAAGC